MLTLLLGADWTENRSEIFRRLADDVKHHRENRILMVPELISHDTERRLASQAGDTVSRYVQVLPFTRLARRMADMVGGSPECLDAGGRIVAMASAAYQLHSRLKAYAAVETKPEFLSQMIDAVDEMKRCCISSADLQAASKQTDGALAQKLEELSLLLEAYDALCEQGKRDPRDQMNWVLEQLEELDFAKEHVFYVDGFPDFTRQHMAILEHFIRCSPHVVISLNCDRVNSKDMAFEKAGSTAQQLIDCARRAGVEVHIEYISQRQDALTPVRAELFQGKLRQQPQLQGTVKAVRAGSVYQVCEAAAQEVMRRVQSGCRYRDIGIVCTEPEAYNPVLRLVFGKCGIPLYQSGTEEVLSSGVIATVLFALDAAVDGLEQRDVLRYLRSTLSPLSQEECDRLENYAVIWCVDRKGWTEDFQGHPQGLFGNWDDESRQQLSELNEARRKAIVPLIRLRQGMKDSTNLAQMVSALTDFLEEISFAQRLEALALDADRAGDHRSAQILGQLWEIFLSALEQLYDVLGGTAWDADVFTRLLKLLLSQCSVGTIPPVLDTVSFGPGSVMRCQQQKHLLVLGANEGSLPRYGGSSGLLSDPERLILRNLGVPLTGGAMDGLQAEFSEIYGYFCGAEESITVFCTQEQPSFIYRRIAEMTGGEIQADTAITDQLRNRQSAASLLVRMDADAAASELELQDAYQQLQKRKNHALGSVQHKNIQALYGKKLHLSASQIDRQAECRLSYFLKYGLRAQERRQATVDPAEYGTYVHAVLEQTAREVMEQGGFHAVSLEETLSIANRHSQAYAKEHFSLLDSKRMEYLFQRNMQELEMVVRELWRELNQAAYEPHSFELNFGPDGQLPAVELPNRAMDAVLRGYVDRVDVWQHGESKFFRVVDYKTGKKDFDYCDVFNGVGLQMLLYLFALEQAGEAVLPGVRVGAGVQYFPARAPYVKTDGSMSEEEAQKARKKLWKRSGLLLSNEDSLVAMDPSEKMDTLCCERKKDGTLSGDLADREQLGLLKDYLMGYLAGMVEDIASGNIAANPYTRGTSHDACTFCPYGSICHKAEVEGRRNYKTMTAQRFWEEVERQVKTNG